MDCLMTVLTGLILGTVGGMIGYAIAKRFDSWLSARRIANIKAMITAEVLGRRAEVLAANTTDDES